MEANLDNAEGIPVYTALSYTWGDRNEDVTIFIDDHPLKISENLAYALDDVVDKAVERSRYLWIDQICINQQDRAERSNQVRYMGYIYEKATAVFVWLGKSGEDHDVAINFLGSWENPAEDYGRPSEGVLLSVVRQMSQETLLWGEIIQWASKERNWNAMNKLTERLWWERAWVVQEATGPAPTYCICGESWISFPDLIQRLIVIESITKLPGYAYNKLSGRRAFCLLMVLDLRTHQQLRLLDALQFLRSSCCTDPRDKIYAVFGLVNQEKEIIVPDYTRPLNQVYKDVVRYCIAEYPPHHRLDFLGYVSGSIEMATKENWPSFVPNWTESPIFDNLKKTTQEYQITDRLYRASLDFTGNISLEGDTLSLDAFDVDAVSYVGETCVTEDDMDAVLESWKPEDPTAGYPTGKTTQEAYLHTLVCDVYRTPNFGLQRGTHFQAELLNGDANSTDEFLNAHHMRTSMGNTVLCRRIFRTKNGYMGMGPAAMQIGDEIWGFLGGQMLYVCQDVCLVIRLFSSGITSQLVHRYMYGVIR